MLWVGVDTHLRMHRIEVQNDLGDRMWRGQISNDRKGFQDLLEKLRIIRKSNSQEIGAVFMNPTANYHAPLKAFLESKEFRVILVDARISEHLRITNNLGKEKSDGADASILASTARLMPKILDRDSHERASLSALTRLAESIGENITRVRNQIKSDIAAIFPEYPYYDEIDSKTSLDILERYTTPEMLLDAPISELSSLIDRASRHHYGMEEAEIIVEKARESIGVPDSENACSFRIRVNVARLREEKEALKRVQKEVERRSAGNNDVENISDIKGIGTLSAACIVSEIGNISQFSSALKLQSYGGKSPDITGSAGKNYATGVTKIRNPHLSNAVYESSVSLVLHRTPEFYEIFNREIRKGKKTPQAYIVVGKRLLYHVFSIMKNHKPYRQRLPREREGGTSSGA